jgi:phospholipase/carboxylesterase
VHYVERILGGARPDEPLPMIVTLHPMGADPMRAAELFALYPGKARLIIPYGHPNGGAYFWYLGKDRATGARDAADRLAPWLSALVAARPTAGKPIVTGFSQGAVVAYALAIAHPQLTRAIFPVSGVLPPALHPRSSVSGERPVVQAFHGTDDPVFPVAQARESVNVMRAAGFRAELYEYPHTAHMPGEAELRDLLSAMAAAARP